MMTLAQYSRLALQLMDLTSLNDNDSEQSVTTLCQQAHTRYGDTAAVCIYPRFIPLARDLLNRRHGGQIRIATVTNFPGGHADTGLALAQTQAAIAAGADEVDVVFPYRALLAGNEQTGFDLVQCCKHACASANVLLKVILETGELKQPRKIRQASQIAIQAGADFLKTSTGKVAENATLASARIMLQTIADMGVQHSVGFKAAGGVRSAEDAAAYLAIAEDMFGADWLTPRHFRFGASGLLQHLLATLDNATADNSQP